VKIALAGAHFHGVGVTRPGSWNTVEKVAGARLWPSIRPQKRHFVASEVGLCTHKRACSSFSTASAIRRSSVSFIRHSSPVSKTILSDALRAQQEAERPRGRRGRRTTGEKRPRKDYTSPEHAGEPHRGRITDEEKAYVQTHLDEVNARLADKGMRKIDPNDPDMAERYGLTPAPTG